MSPTTPTALPSSTCPIPRSRIERCLEACVRAGASRVALLDLDGRTLAAAARGGGSESRRHHAGAGHLSCSHLVVGGEARAVLEARWPRAPRPAEVQLVATTATHLADVWASSEESDSLAAELLHAYDELHLLYDLGALLSGDLTLSEAAEIILEKTLEVVAADRAELWLADAQVPLHTCDAPTAQGGDGAQVRYTTELRSGGESIGSLVLIRSQQSPPLSSSDGKLVAAVGTLAGMVLRNVHLLRHVREREAHLRAVLDNIGEAILVVDEEGAVTSFNPAAERLFGHESARIVGRHVGALLTPPYERELRRRLRRVLRGYDSHDLATPREAVARRANGTTVPIELVLSEVQLQRQRAFIVSARDITDRKQVQDALEHQAMHDILTGLPNRALLQDRLQEGILSSHRYQQPLALLFLDLDRFKDVNDTLGHHYGDLLLRDAAQRLAGTLRTSDTIARLGGDEFAVVLPRSDAAGARLVARRLLRCLAEPFPLEGHEISLSASIGIASCPEHGTDAETLMRRADIAMYVAKRAGSGFTIYSPDQDDNYNPFRLALLNDLPRAMAEDELELHFQPKVDVRTGRVTCVEALVRWQHPQHGLLMPEQFVPLAEQAGRIQALSQWVLNAALRQRSAWADQGIDLAISVNLAGRNLQDPQLVPTIRALLEKWGAPAGRLIVEIQERSLAVEPQRAMDALEQLSELGVQIAIDDFGAGYASLAYLERLPVTELKIDRSFVEQVVLNDQHTTIVRSAIGLGHDLGASIVAEGVEDRATLELLTELGCDAFQGYYLSRPVPGPELQRWLLALPEAVWGRGLDDAA